MWRVWLRDHESEYDRFSYNVHVGEGVRSAERTAHEDPEIDARVREQFRRATQKRIDVVGWQGPITWIFEIEDRPGMRALGQLAVYETLLPRYVDGVGQIELAVICRSINPDLLPAFQATGALIYRVELPD